MLLDYKGRKDNNILHRVWSQKWRTNLSWIKTIINKNKIIKWNINNNWKISAWKKIAYKKIRARTIKNKDLKQKVVVML